jgi:D-glycero-D-manno-heptose 1,7-bisphosphate phosphatase
VSVAAVFLDRDGVLTEASVLDGVPQSPRLASEMVIDSKAPAACSALAEAGMRLVCITNQPEIARGNLDPAELEAMNERLRRELPLDAIMVCPHDDPDGCECRKPKPGMIFDAAERLSLDLASSFTVGDRWRDVEAGRSAGTKTVLIDRGYEVGLTTPPDHVVGDIEEASEWIIEQSERR